MKPILFNTEMVRAILDGRKTVTRRLIKNIHNDAEMVGTLIDSTLREDTKNIGKLWFKVREPGLTRNEYVKFPYQLGDVLYIRETWWNGDILNANEDIEEYDVTLYATGPDRENLDYESIKWKPSIHMPKEAARIFLRVTGVRAERLRAMSIEDMINEGINTKGIITSSGPIEYRVINRFEELWDSTVKKSDADKYSFSASPWVWVIEFERISKEEAYE